jgi:hypothetical protein
MRRVGTVVFPGVVVASSLGAPVTARAQRASTCASIHEHVHDTVIVFQPPSAFTICRNGRVEDDVVTGRPVYFELTPTPGSSMFDFRLHGQSSEWRPTGLAAWEDQALRISVGLRDLESSGESIADIVVPETPSAASPLRPVAAARARYLGVVTPRYVENLQGVRAEAGELPVIADVVRRWCSELHADQPASVAVGAELQARCASPELKEGAIKREVQVFEAASTAFTTVRLRARDLMVNAVARPDDAAAVSGAVAVLDDARAAATTVVTSGAALRDASRALATDVATLRSAIRSIDAVRPEVPTYLSTYESSGNAELQVDAMPVDIAAVGLSAEQKTAGSTTIRFPVVGRHYFDIEAGVGVTSGVPDIPSVATQNNQATVQSRPVDEFVGLALVELEPARFLWPDRPLAGLVRLPVIGVPFTRDPTQNFFVGGGLGWTGVGSVTAGPYLLRELTLKSGYQVGQVLPAGTSFDAATEAALQVGYFVSASVDLLGVFHLFFPGHASAIDAVTGKEK